MGKIVKVCIPHTLHDAFDYELTSGTPLIGTRVKVPFRKQTKVGIITGIAESAPTYAIKPIEKIIDPTPILSEEIMNLCLWVAKYYQSPLSEVLPLAMPKHYREGKPCQLATETIYTLLAAQEKAHEMLSKNAPKQHQLIDYLAQSNHPVSEKDLVQAGYTQSQIASLLTKDILTQQSRPKLSVPPCNTLQSSLNLNSEQESALDTIIEHLHQYRCFLLDGVTGSGKTEVYLQTMASVLAQGRQALILVPEIGLTPQLLQRFQKRFTHPIAVLHSRLNDTERQQAWQLASNNIAKIIIGTRTAVFTPLPSLGIIIIDEEHDTSFKQMEGVRYSARETALMRAHQNNIPIILGSATPSLETLHNAQTDKYQHLILRQKAITHTPLCYQILDMRNQPTPHGLAEPALFQMEQHIKAGNQVLVFINRRGYSPVLFCHQCGWVSDCQACDSHLTYHQTRNKLICHHCGLAQKVPAVCKKCQSSELIHIGSGTQRIEEYLQTKFPNTPMLRIDRDQTSKKHALKDALKRIEKEEVQLIIGTQMLAKGHHFPRLTLVVVLDADNGLYSPDFRALERLGQLLTQVAGRAGRAEHAGKVIIQTHLPQHPLLNTLIQQGYQPFAKALLELRQESMLPPYQHLALIRAQARDNNEVVRFLQDAKQCLIPYHLTLLGPAPAPLARKAGQYRMQLLIQSKTRQKLHQALTQLRSSFTIPTNQYRVRWNIDIDPMDLS